MDEGPEAETALLDLKDRICKVGYPAPLQDAYLKEIGRRLDEIDLTYRTAFGMEYPTRERAAAAKKKYELLSRQVASPDAKKNAETLRKVIDNAELPVDLKASLQSTLFQHENAKELKTAKKLNFCQCGTASCHSWPYDRIRVEIHPFAYRKKCSALWLQSRYAGRRGL